MKTRIKLPLLTITTRDEAESVMTELALTQNNQRTLIARRDDLVLELNKQFESPLAECDQAIKEKTQALKDWAETNPDQFPKHRKSIQMTSGVLGFRTGTPKLALLSRAWNWDKVLAAMKSISDMAAGFIRTKEEVSKEDLISFYTQAEFAPDADVDLRRIGLRLTQDETFFTETDLTPIETRQTTDAS